MINSGSSGILRWFLTTMLKLLRIMLVWSLIASVSFSLITGGMVIVKFEIWLVLLLIPFYIILHKMAYDRRKVHNEVSYTRRYLQAIVVFVGLFFMIGCCNEILSSGLINCYFTTSMMLLILPQVFLSGDTEVDDGVDEYTRENVNI